MHHAVSYLMFICFTLAATLAWADQDAAPLPDSSDFRARAQALQSDFSDFPAALSAARTERCTFDGTWRCEVLKTDAYSAGGAAWTPESLTLVDVVWRDGARASLVTVQKARVEFEGFEVPVHESTWTFELVTVESEKVRLDGGTYVSDIPRLRFQTAVQEDGSWRVTELKSDLAPLGAVAAGEPKSGPLIPRSRFGSNIFEFDVGWIFGIYPELSLAPIAAMAPAEWYGAGLGVITSGSHLAEVHLRWDSDTGELEPFATGSLAVHDGARQRLGAHLEHPGTDDYWGVRRLESDAWMRSVRRSEFGASASGPAHTLMASAWIDSELDQSVLEFDRWLVGTRYGTRFVDSDLIEADIDLESLTRIQGDEDRAHSATATLDLAMPIGRRSRALFAPRLIGIANFGVLPEDLGFEASTTIQLLAGLDANLAFRGGSDSLRHLVIPRVGMRAELYGVFQRPVLPPTAPEFLYTGIPGFTLVDIWLDQRLETDTITLEFPVGVIATATDVADLITNIVPAARPRLATPWFDLSGDLVCTLDCSELRFAGRAATDFLSSALKLGVGAHRISSDEVAMLTSATRRVSVLELARLTQNLTPTPAAWGGSAWLDVMIAGPWSAYAAVEYVERDDLTGGRVRVSYTPFAAGFSLVADAASRSDETFLGFVGFRADGH